MAKLKGLLTGSIPSFPTVLAAGSGNEEFSRSQGYVGFRVRCVSGIIRTSVGKTGLCIFSG